MASTSPSMEDKQLAAISHALGIVTSFVAPLIILLINKKKSPFVDSQAKEALNFQITLLAAGIANAILSVVLFFVWWLVAWAVSLGLAVLSIWWGVLGFLAANRGESYRYPFAFRIIA